MYGRVISAIGGLWTEYWAQNTARRITKILFLVERGTR